MYREKIIDSLFPSEGEIPEMFRLRSTIHQREYLINGQLRLWDGEMQQIYSPIYVKSGSVFFQKHIGSCPILSARESFTALEAAERAYKQGRGLWPMMPIRERIKCIEDFTRLMMKKKSEIVTLLMWEVGKSYYEAENEFERTVQYIQKTSDAANDLGQSSASNIRGNGIIGYVNYSPLGVALCMGPFNYPLFESLSTIIPALLMGNTVICKPPKQGVLIYSYLLNAFQDSFPPGVINTVYGKAENVISPIMSSGKIDIFAFVGSSNVGTLLRKQHPKPHRLRSVLGLQAKNPAIILQDADIDLTVRECIQGSFSFNGQRCTALKILFVHEGIIDDFLKIFLESMDNIVVGMPWQKDVMITPLAEFERGAYLTGLLENAKQYGAQVINKRGGKVDKTMFYPALVYPVTPDMRLYNEEQFGPVVPIVPFEDIELPMKYIVGSCYSQQASIFGNNNQELATIIEFLQKNVCRVNINTMCQRGPDTLPFSGRRDSGEGTLSVSDTLQLFSQKSLVAAKDAQFNRELLTMFDNEKKPTCLSLVTRK